MQNQLVIIENNGSINTVDIHDGDIFGRVGGANSIPVNSQLVSSQHGMFNVTPYGVYLTDLGSLNGTYVSGKKIGQGNRQPGAPCVLHDGDIISVHPSDKSNRLFSIFCQNTNNYTWKAYPLSASITIGRTAGNTIVVPDNTVSRNHAVIRYENGLIIDDLNSVNGVFVGHNRINRSQKLFPGDIIRIASAKFVVTDNSIVVGISAPFMISPVNQGMTGQKKVRRNIKSFDGIAGCQGGMPIVVTNVSRTVKCKPGTGTNGGNTRKILDNISLKINSGELVAILGGSGAGKTTFMNTLTGFEPATEGIVQVDGANLVSDGKLIENNYKALKSKMGYVPQQDIVHEDLRLHEMLMFTGRLRLPPDTSKADLEKRVEAVLAMLDLSAHRDTMIKSLSGGQKKRASIGVELLSDPPLMFLDEPTSGLDPEAETNLMHCLENIVANQKKTIIVITHTLQNIELFDKVIFLAPGGKLCFCGTVPDAKQFFGVENLTEAYEKISKDINGYVTRFNNYSQGGRR